MMKKVKLDSYFLRRIERVLELTDLTFDHPEFDNWSDPQDYSELFFTVCSGEGVHGKLSEPWMGELNAPGLEECEATLKRHGVKL